VADFFALAERVIERQDGATGNTADGGNAMVLKHLHN